jgi:hypothetical protein
LAYVSPISLFDVSDGAIKTFNINDNVRVLSVVTKQSNYDLNFRLKPAIWLKVEMLNGNKGYIPYYENKFILSNSVSTQIERCIEYYTLYPFNNDYTQNPNTDFGISPSVNEKNIIKTNVDYQVLLQAVLYEYKNAEVYRDSGFTLDGFTLVGICFGESNATRKKNLFGSTMNLPSKEQDVGKEAVISALLKSGLAATREHAIVIINNDDGATGYSGKGFYTQVGKLIGHLEYDIKLHTKNGIVSDLDISTNYTSYARAEANAINWRNFSTMSDKSDIKYYSYQYYNDSQIISRIGDLANLCSKLGG